MSISNTYKFYITIPNQTIPIEFKPAIDSIKFTDKKYKKECFFRKELDTELIIDDCDLFVTLYELHQDKCRCNVLPIRIDKCCCGVWTENYHNGLFSFNDGDWNPEGLNRRTGKPLLSFKLRDQDEYSCLLRDWEKEKNYLDIEDRVNVITNEGQLVCIDQQFNIARSARIRTMYLFALSNGPTGYGVRSIETIPFVGSNQGTSQKTIIVTYCRWETSTAPTSPLGWTQGLGGWTRPIQTSLSNYEFDREENIYTFIDVNFQSDNGITLKNFLEFYLSDCYDCIVSNFFGINADNTAPDNLAYQCAANDLHDLVLFQSLEVVGGALDGSFSVGIVEGALGVKAYKNVWKDLKAKFNLCMFVDKETGCLRIEHASYRQTGRILNLIPDSDNCLFDKGNFTVDPIDIPYKELLTYKYDTGDTDFNDGNITYDPDCSNPDEDTKEIDTPIECFLNDVSSIYRREDLETNDSVVNNITMISTTGGVINSAVGAISGEVKLNAQLATANLIAKYWLWDRPQCIGYVNGTFTTFLSTLPINKQPTIQIGISCDDYNQLNPEIDKVRTQFGDTVIESMSYSDPSGLLDVDVRF